MRTYKNLGPAIDALHKARDERLALDRKSKKMRESEYDLEQQIIQLLRKQKVEKAQGKLGSVSLGKRPIAAVDDWESVRKFVTDNDAWDILLRGINASALRDRVEEEGDVPGVKLEFMTRLNLGKRQ